DDGIRDDLVTGVQTCALPICELLELGERHVDDPDELVEPGASGHQGAGGLGVPGAERLGGGAELRGIAARRARGAIEQGIGYPRSEERRVGKEWRCRRGPEEQ